MASLAVIRDDIVPATHRRADVRETIEELRNQNPRMGVDHLTEALCGRLTEDTHLLRAAARFVVERVLVTIETRRRMSRAAPSPRERAERRVAERTGAPRPESFLGPCRKRPSHLHLFDSFGNQSIGL
jgi:hypothetical protein